MFYCPIAIIWDKNQECLQISDPCIQSQSEVVWSFFDHKYTANLEKVILCENRSINIWWKKRISSWEKKSGKRCFKKSENFEWQPQALLPGQYSFFPVGHLISFSELRTPPAVSGTMAKSDHIGRIGKKILKRLSFVVAELALINKQAGHGS